MTNAKSDKLREIAKRVWHEINNSATPPIEIITNALAEQHILTTANGDFICTSEHAVNEAYLLSCAEAAVFRNRDDRFEIGMQLGMYVAGDCDLQKALDSMNEDIAP